jgi:poly(3-hydroxybutyrate) depolymerase
MDGRAIARRSGLARRGPAAGITTVFPDGWKGAWHAIRPPDREPDLDDVLFLSALSSHLEFLGAAESWPVFLAGIAQGALFAEHVARHGLLPVAGLFLVAGSALEVSRRLAPAPRLHTTMTMIVGTGDRVIPYQGGRLARRGVAGMLGRRRAIRHGELPGEDSVASAVDVAADWAAGNGIAPGTEPLVEELPGDRLDLPVTRTTWTAPGCRPVTLYRINGGGHGWPSAAQQAPAHATGPAFAASPVFASPASASPASASPAFGSPALATRSVDATGLLLGMAERESANAAGYHTLERLRPSPLCTPGIP